MALDVSRTCSFAHVFLICHGQQIRQTQAIADAIEEALKSKSVVPDHVEGYRRGEWILMDYGDLVVHIFTPDRREFFSLERLWGDVPRKGIGEKPKKKRGSGSARG